MSSNATAAAPFVVPATGWGGNDGNWSSFSLSVGTPPQSFSLLPSITGSEIWVPLPQGCEGALANVSSCGSMRGVHDFLGKQSTGFQYFDSSSWQTIGVYQLSNFEELFVPSANGLYGLDTVLLSNSTGSSDRNVSFSGQLVAGVAAWQTWLGSLGLGVSNATFSSRNANISSLLGSMVDQNQVPGDSVGYTAGAHYSSQTPGSVVFGGYDQSRFRPSNISFPISFDSGAPKLPVSIQSLVGDGLDGSLYSFTTDGAFTAYIDSTISQSQFPQAVCDRFAAKYGLRFDSSRGLYLVNSTIHTQLLSTNPNITLTLAPPGNTSQVTNIVLPYAAFDLQVGIPFYNFSTNYFPIRVAPNDNQVILGRQFLQEAYVFVDWDRGNFTLGQAIHQNATSDIITVHAPSTTSSSTSSSHLSGGAIAGIVIAVLAALAFLSAATFFLLHRRRRRRQHHLLAKQNGEIYSKDEKSLGSRASEILSDPVYELHEDPYRSELSAQTYAELPGDVPAQEADSTPVGFSFASSSVLGAFAAGGTGGSGSAVQTLFPVSPLSVSSAGAGCHGHERNASSLVSPVSASGYGSDSGTGPSSGEQRVLLLGELSSREDQRRERGEQMPPPRYERRGGG